MSGDKDQNAAAIEHALEAARAVALKFVTPPGEFAAQLAYEMVATIRPIVAAGVRVEVLTEAADAIEKLNKHPDCVGCSAYRTAARLVRGLAAKEPKE